MAFTDGIVDRGDEAGGAALSEPAHIYGDSNLNCIPVRPRRAELDKVEDAFEESLWLLTQTG